MRKMIFIVIILILSILTGCDDNNTDNLGLKELGIDKSKGQLDQYIDTHGSLGDGSTYIKISFDGENADTVENELKESKYWRQLPLSGNLQTAVYGDEDNLSLVDSFGNDIPSIPTISDGYYYFKDRHSESKDSSDDSALFSRYSYNFDIIIYDMEKHILYIFKLDT